MILGVAQLVFNAARLDPCAQTLVRTGYQPSFREDGLPSAPVKAPFLSTAREALAMAHFAAPSAGLAIEVTAYEGAEPGGRAAYGVDDGEASAARSTESLLDEVSHPIRRVHVRSADPDASVAFWTSLGFRAGEHEAELAFPALLPAWRLDLTIETAEGVACADADGLVLVTLLSSDIEADFDRHAGKGRLRYAAPWDERVGDGPVRVALIEGPGGELIELLQAPSRR